ncbi:Ig-like domain-containing protein [Pleionea litopenaei]|uniref:Tandem-95 repeat protein n=1 Tax=Pleionea litopenaei TaxID=3070815 RepID=A0AA51RWR4_9GAMM|nr:Ig-like domain-containing protein [Pleionea sp. HL-JVS1]WMS88925.1 tandem-95 repeat protein [Pleionea sp. HL-JVS1]
MMSIRRFFASVLVIALFLPMSAFAQRVAIFDGKLFTWHPGIPDVTTINFNDKPAENWSLTVFNGGFHSTYCRMSSATIKINDVVIAGPADINLQTAKFSTPVDIQSSNVLSVELAQDNDCVIELYLVGVGITQSLSITSSPMLQASVGEAYSYTLQTSPTIDWNSSNVTLNTAPNGMTVTSGVLNWTPTSAEVGNQDINLTVSNSQYGNAQQSFTVAVSATNQAPEASDLTVQTNEDQVLLESLVAQDGNGDSLTYEVVTPAQNGALSLNGEQFQYTPVADYFGNDSFTYRVFDGELYSNSATVNIQVVAQNDAPRITSTPLAAVNQLQTYSYQVVAEDVDGDSLTYQLSQSPAGATIDANGLVTWYAGQVENVNFTVVVADTTGLTDSQSFSVDVVDVNEAPSISSSPVTTLEERNLYTYAVVATDPDANDVLTYSLPQGPLGMVIDTVTGEIAWNTDASHIGDHLVQLLVTDQAGLTAEQSFTISVIDRDDAPVITSTPVTQGSEDNG